jgi:hypothetical protein
LKHIQTKAHWFVGIVLDSEATGSIPGVCFNMVANSADLHYNRTMMKEKIISALDLVAASLMMAASIAVPFALYFYGVLPL